MSIIQQFIKIYQDYQQDKTIPKELYENTSVMQIKFIIFVLKKIHNEFSYLNENPIYK